jgi:pimeloyl-ACP methyl ester carboxylesterase
MKKWEILVNSFKSVRAIFLAHLTFLVMSTSATSLASGLSCTTTFLDTSKLISAQLKIEDKVMLARERLSAQTKKTIRVSKNDLVYFEYLPGDSDKTPALLFGGLYYELSNFQAYKEQLALQGVPLIVVSRRTQPESLLEMQKKGIKPSFLSSSERPDLEVFADDHRAVVESLGFKKVNVMTLSYGSSVGLAFVQKFPEMYGEISLVAPLMFTGDSMPDVYSNQTNMEMLYRLNPFTGSLMISALRETMASANADRIVDGMIAPNPNSIGAQVSLEWMKAGIKADTRAVERGRFDLREVDLAKFKKAKVYLASLENPYLLKEQFEHLDKAAQENPNLKVVFFEGAMHALTASAPAYLTVVESIMDRGQLPKDQMYYVNTTDPNFNFSVINSRYREALGKDIQSLRISEMKPSVLAPLLSAQLFKKQIKFLEQNAIDLSDGLSSKGPFSSKPFDPSLAKPERPFENLKNHHLSPQERALVEQRLLVTNEQLKGMKEKLELALKMDQQ